MYVEKISRRARYPETTEVENKINKYNLKHHNNMPIHQTIEKEHEALRKNCPSKSFQEQFPAPAEYICSVDVHANRGYYQETSMIMLLYLLPGFLANSHLPRASHISPFREYQVIIFINIIHMYQTLGLSWLRVN